MAQQHETPDFVIGAGAPTVPRRRRRVDTDQALAWVILLSLLLGPAPLAFVIRMVTSTDTWVPLFGLFLVALLGLLAAGWAADKASMVRRARQNVIPAGEPEKEARYEALALAFVVFGEAAAAAASEPWVGLALVGALVAWAAFCTVTPQRRLRTGWTLQVTASPDAVFRFMSNPRNMPRWQPREELLEPVPDHLSVGTVLHVRAETDSGRTVESSTVCDELVPGRRFAFSVVGAFENRGVTTVDQAPVGGGTKITYAYEGTRNVTTMMVGRGFVNAAVRPKIEARYREHLALLKPLLEAEASASV